MNPYIKSAFDKTVALFTQNPMVVAAYHSGSVGTEREDEFSDVDPVFVIKAESFFEFDRQLPALFEQAVAKPILWWPERWIWRPGAEKDIHIHRNYAIFFEWEGKLLQYDMNFIAAPQHDRIRVSQNQFIFDKTGILEITPETTSSPEGMDSRKLVWTIQMYLIYVYIHAKYIKRRDLFKLLYAQQELFHEHLVILQYLESNPVRGWWPLIADRITPSGQENLFQYFSEANIDIIKAKLPEQVRLFSEDAQRACAKWQVSYPEAFEAHILAYLANIP
ncbi:MAG: aminoglycoside 6-adenylyltransferase [Anaerolineae bacterium]|nr:aminoglycoside 6-adenylyltransferase [Anaerolineae bacterium]